MAVDRKQVSMPGAQGAATRWKRMKGGFRGIVETELGEEQLCASCQQLWPLDAEFFLVTKQVFSYECRACIQERRSARESKGRP